MACTAWSVRGRAPRIALSLMVGFCASSFSLLCLPSLLSAQTVSPQIVEFTPSTDHNRTVNGFEVVEGYELRFYTVGGTQELHVIEMGKPSPQTDGTIRFNFTSLLGVWPVNGVVYEARVAAIGPGGSTESATSNQFVFQVTAPPPPPPPPPSTCSYSLSSTFRSGSSAATTGTLNVATTTGCAWTASSSAGWLTVTGGGSGTGNGTVNYSVAANTASGARSATLTIGTAAFTVTQNGSCAFTATPTSQGFNPASATGTVTVSAASGCSWTATRSGSWITITSGASGTGNGTVRYRVSANTGSSSRTGTLTVAGQPVVITQSAATAPNAPAGLRIVTVR
jgi:Putative binding domain, N-terminal/Viral BACON domain